MSNAKLVTKDDLKEMYQRILPYLGGSADAGFTPIGTIIAVMGNDAPANYLPCDGRVVNISDYPELADYFKEQFGSSNYFGGDGTTTFGIVDLSGEFLRGAGTNSHENQGSGAEVGEHQDSTEVLSMWSNTGKQLRIRLESTSLATVLNEDASTIYQTSQQYLPSTTEQTSEASYQGVRPTNTSVLFCIATKNIYLNPSLDFSTSEKVVGTWIDGKPLYQKTFVTEAPTVVTQGTEVHEFIDIGASVEYSSLVSVENDAGVATTNTALKFWVDESTTPKSATPIWYVTLFNNTHATTSYQNKIRLSASDTGTNGHTFYVTIQYTKTTD